MSNVRPYALPPWWAWNFWEPTVLAALPDFCKPGTTVFDVGMNVGGLSLAMSRLVGPRGKVCAFEASSRIVAEAQANMVESGCSNVTIYNRAVYIRSGETIRIYGSETYYNDSIYNRPSYGEVYTDVETMAIDDFVGFYEIVPAFIKMDIEGAELDALEGAKGVISTFHPPLILEQTPDDLRCLELLISLGYEAVDLAGYTTVQSASDFILGTGVANVLFLKKGTDSPYLRAGHDRLLRFGADAIVAKNDREIGLSSPIELPPGRYIIKADMSASGMDNEVYAGLEDNTGTPLVRAHTFTSFLASSYTSWVLTLRRTTLVQPYLRFLTGSDPTLKWSGLTVTKLQAFGNISRFSPV